MALINTFALISTAKGERIIAFAYPHVHASDLPNLAGPSTWPAKLLVPSMAHCPQPQQAPPPASQTPMMGATPDAFSLKGMKLVTSTLTQLARSDAWSLPRQHCRLLRVKLLPPVQCWLMLMLELQVGFLFDQHLPSSIIFHILIIFLFYLRSFGGPTPAPASGGEPCHHHGER